jgi:hypothetical protein
MEKNRLGVVGYMAKIRWGIEVLVLLALLIIANLITIGRPEWVGHMVSHLTASAAILGIFIIMRRGPGSLWLSWVGKLGPVILIAGLGGIFLGSIVEAAAAVIEFPNDGILHNISSKIVAISVILTCIGLFIYLFKRIRIGKLPRWTAWIIVPIALVLLFGLLRGF